MTNSVRIHVISLRWRHNGCDSVSNHQPHHCLLNRLFRRRSKKTSKFRVTGLCSGNSPGTGEFSAQMASNAENVSIWWRHHVDVTSDPLHQSCPYCAKMWVIFQMWITYQWLSAKLWEYHTNTLELLQSCTKPSISCQAKTDMTTEWVSNNDNKGVVIGYTANE